MRASRENLSSSRLYRLHTFQHFKVNPSCLPVWVSQFVLLAVLQAGHCSVLRNNGGRNLECLESSHCRPGAWTLQRRAKSLRRRSLFGNEFEDHLPRDRVASQNSAADERRQSRNPSRRGRSKYCASGCNVCYRLIDSLDRSSPACCARLGSNGFVPLHSTPR